MLQGFTGWHALIILVVVVLLFGATKLPGLAKSVGQSMKIFRSEMKSSDSEQGSTEDKAKDSSDDSQSTPKS
jgi:sec-independent protein translocase protein TatA